MNVPSHPEAGAAARYIRERAAEVGVESLSDATRRLKEAGVEGTRLDARVYNYFRRRLVPAEGVPLLTIILGLDDAQRLRLFDMIAEDKATRGDVDEDDPDRVAV